MLTFKMVSFIKMDLTKINDLNVRYKNSLFLKFSYLLVLWLKYFNNRILKVNKFKFSYLPKKRFHFYFSKAPMAHKTNSLEKYFCEFYFFKFKVNFKKSFLSVNFKESIIFLSFFLKNMPIIPSNAAQLKSISYRLPMMIKLI